MSNVRKPQSAKSSAKSPRGWTTTTVITEQHALQVLADLQGRSWIARGHSEARLTLRPSIDRGKLRSVQRTTKLARERRCIDIFRSTARFFASPGEEGALVDDFIALAVLRHHGVPTRLLDWSSSPYVAAYFSVSGHDRKDGDLWAFSYRDYVTEGSKQWQTWKQETTTDGSGDPTKFSAALTAFTIQEPPPWIIMMFYPTGFPRQNAQRGAYTMTGRFNLDHGQVLRRLLQLPERYHRYVIPGGLKARLRAVLREEHGLWQGSLFPDAAGAAKTASAAFPP